LHIKINFLAEKQQILLLVELQNCRTNFHLKQNQIPKITGTCRKYLNICLFEKEQLMSIPLYKVLQASQIVGIRTRTAMSILKAMAVLLMLVSGVFADGKPVVGSPHHRVDIDKCGSHCQTVMNSCVSHCRKFFLSTFTQCRDKCMSHESFCNQKCKENGYYP